MKKEYGYVSGAILLWGCSATISKLFFNGLNTYFILMVTSFLSMITICIYTLLIHKSYKGLSIKNIFKMSLVGCFGLFLCNYFYLNGVSLLAAQQAFVINYLWPAFVIIFSYPILKERITSHKMMAILLSFLGVIIVATNGNIQSILGGKWLGILYCVLGALFYGLYSPLNKKQDYDKDIALIVGYGFTTIICLIFSMSQHAIVSLNSFQWIGMILFGIFVNGLAYLFWVKALEIGDTAIISNLAYLTPVVSLFVTHFVLKEQITVYSILGLILILSGVLVQMKRR